ncbi:CheR family methyltransferase [Novosphingobium sp.]|uniref:CheR family methyltransferase n=1 Tax=Novosphingobium sp. TaxID=1874826 RepID=UPI003D0E6FB5
MTGGAILNPVEHTFTASEIVRIGDCLYAWTGMVFRENKRYFIERRISERMKRSGKPGVDAYLDHAATHSEEREALISAFTINESYFYREDHQFGALSAHILPAIVASKQPGDKLRILSLPCSTGDEPYSIAIWLLENWAMVDAYNVEIVGSDIDYAALAAARLGWFGAKALARLSPDLIAAYFGEEQRHRRQIIDPLRESVQYIHANIIDRTTLAPLGTFDVIFCRNLLIYFDDKARHSAVENVFDCLNPGGFICLGHSESLARISNRFAMVRYDNAIVYRRP